MVVGGLVRFPGELFFLGSQIVGYQYGFMEVSNSPVERRKYLQVFFANGYVHMFEEREAIQAAWVLARIAFINNPELWDGE